LQGEVCRARRCSDSRGGDGMCGPRQGTLGPGCGDATSKDCQQGSCPIHSGVGCTGLITNLLGEIACLCCGRKESPAEAGPGGASRDHSCRAAGGGRGASRGRGGRRAALGKEMAIEQDDRRHKVWSGGAALNSLSAHSCRGEINKNGGCIICVYYIHVYEK
jgi:hypothetical protein